MTDFIELVAAVVFMVIFIIAVKSSLKGGNLEWGDLQSLYMLVTSGTAVWIFIVYLNKPQWIEGFRSRWVTQDAAPWGLTYEATAYLAGYAGLIVGLLALLFSSEGSVAPAAPPAAPGAPPPPAPAAPNINPRWEKTKAYGGGLLIVLGVWILCFCAATPERLEEAHRIFAQDAKGKPPEGKVDTTPPPPDTPPGKGKAVDRPPTPPKDKVVLKGKREVIIAKDIAVPTGCQLFITTDKDHNSDEQAVKPGQTVTLPEDTGIVVYYYRRDADDKPSLAHVARKQP